MWHGFASRCRKRDSDINSYKERDKTIWRRKSINRKSTCWIPSIYAFIHRMPHSGLMRWWCETRKPVDPWRSLSKYNQKSIESGPPLLTGGGKAARYLSDGKNNVEKHQNPLTLSISCWLWEDFDWFIFKNDRKYGTMAAFFAMSHNRHEIYLWEISEVYVVKRDVYTIPPWGWYDEKTFLALFSSDWAITIRFAASVSANDYVGFVGLFWTIMKLLKLIRVVIRSFDG